MCAGATKVGNQRRLDEVLGLFSVLAGKKDDPAGPLSGVQQQMVAIGGAMMGRPRHCCSTSVRSASRRWSSK